MNQKELDTLRAILNPSDVKDKISARLKALRYLDTVEITEDESEKQISGPQRGAIHLYLGRVAQEARRKGLTLQEMVKVISKLEIWPTTKNLKEVFLKPYIEKAYQLKSSEKMSNQQIDETYDALNKLFSHYWQIHIPFPNDAERQMEKLSGEKIGAINNKSNQNYPEYTGAPTI